MDKKRDSFASRWGFIMACIGSAVGMGNIWLFPTRVSLFGGGAFLIPYFIFVVLIAKLTVLFSISSCKIFTSKLKRGFQKSPHLSLNVHLSVFLPFALPLIS